MILGGTFLETLMLENGALIVVKGLGFRGRNERRYSFDGVSMIFWAPTS